MLRTQLTQTHSLSPRLQREQCTIAAMLNFYCKHHHQHQKNLCPECEQLFTYATQRLRTCPFSHQKPTCAKCTIHCYSKVMQQRIKQVMRYSGPRFLFRHPWLTLRHLIDRHYQARELPTHPKNKKIS